MWHSSREARKEDRSRCLLAADRKPTVDQRKVTAEVLLGEPVSATGVAYENTGEGFLQEQKRLVDICVPKPILPGLGGRAHKLGTWSRLHSLPIPYRSERVLSR